MEEGRIKYFFTKRKAKAQMKRKYNESLLEFYRLKTQDPKDTLTQLNFRLLFIKLEELEKLYHYYELPIAESAIRDIDYQASFYCLSHGMNKEAIRMQMMHRKELLFDKL